MGIINMTSEYSRAKCYFNIFCALAEISNRHKKYQQVPTVYEGKEAHSILARSSIVKMVGSGPGEGLDVHLAL
jgi:hypothetical protein